MIALAERVAGYESAVVVDGPQLLDAWESYLQFAEGNPEAVQDKGGIVALLKRCATALASRKWRGNLRSLTVMITYIDGCETSDAISVFETMYSQGLGLQFSLLYEVRCLKKYCANSGQAHCS